MDGALALFFWNFLQVEIIWNPSFYILEKINENYDKNIFGNHDALKFMGHKSYVLLCSKMTSFPPSEGSAKSPLAPSVLDLYELL